MHHHDGKVMMTCHLKSKGTFVGQHTQSIQRVRLLTGESIMSMMQTVFGTSMATTNSCHGILLFTEELMYTLDFSQVSHK